MHMIPNCFSLLSEEQRLSEGIKLTYERGKYRVMCGGLYIAMDTKNQCDFTDRYGEVYIYLAEYKHVYPLQGKPSFTVLTRPRKTEIKQLICFIDIKPIERTHGKAIVYYGCRGTATIVRKSKGEFLIVFENNNDHLYVMYPSGMVRFFYRKGNYLLEKIISENEMLTARLIAVEAELLVVRNNPKSYHAVLYGVIELLFRLKPCSDMYTKIINFLKSQQLTPDMKVIINDLSIAHSDEKVKTYYTNKNR